MEQRDQQVVETRLLEAPTVRDYLDDFAIRAGRHLGVDTEVCITLRHAGSDRLAAGSHPRAARCDEVEYAAGEGPCVTAADLMQVVVVPVIAHDDRWPAWRQAALEEGFASAAGVPAHVADGVEIVLNLYADHVDAWDGPLLLQADTYAQQVALTVGLCLEVAQLQTGHGDAQESLRELQEINRLLVSAIADDEETVGQLLSRLHEVVRSRSTDAETDVRAIIRDVTRTAADGRDSRREST